MTSSSSNRHRRLIHYLQGPEFVRDAHWTAIKTAFSAIPGAKFFFPSDLPADQPHVLHNRHRVLQGLPSFEELKWIDWRPNGAHIGFSPVSRLNGDDALRQYELARTRAKEAGFDYMGTFTVGMREMRGCSPFPLLISPPWHRKYWQLTDIWGSRL